MSENTMMLCAILAIPAYLLIRTILIALALKYKFIDSDKDDLIFIYLWPIAPLLFIALVFMFIVLIISFNVKSLIYKIFGVSNKELDEDLASFTPKFLRNRYINRDGAHVLVGKEKLLSKDFRVSIKTDKKPYTEDAFKELRQKLDDIFKGQ